MRLPPKRSLTLCSLKSLFFLALIGATTHSHAQRDRRDGIWRINKDRWSAGDEAGFSSFVQTLGLSRCNTTSKCLTHDSNPYKLQNPDWIKTAYADCADLPYVLRMYYAYMNDLPFSYQSKMAPRGKSRDIRYSANGNSVSARRIIRSGESLKTTMTEMRNLVSTAMFRTPPDSEANAGSELFTDLYPVKISRQSIKPGTTIYDPNGHAAMVYKVETDGRIFFMDGHPDNSITRGTYGAKFIRSKPTSGAGFKNWRPFVQSANKISATNNSLISDYSLEQYFGNHNASDNIHEWKQGAFVNGGIRYDYYDYVRVMLAEGNLKYHPPQELKNMLEALCQDIKDRILSVDEAVQAGIHKKAHPVKLPYNIYGTEGEWETYSTPSRDARLKASFLEAQTKLSQFIKMVQEKSPQIDFVGSVDDVKQQMLDVHLRVNQACSVQYKNSAGQMVELNLRDIEERLWDLSFSPYHCPELRWGAKGQELSTCPDNQNKLAWYSAQERLRNQVERTYETRMDFSLEELTAKKPGSGIDSAPTVDIRALLTR